MNEHELQIIHVYSRAHAVAAGLQVDVSNVAAEAGIRFPVFLTRGVYHAYVSVPPNVIGQDEAGRLWDVLWMLRLAILNSAPRKTRLPFALYVRNDNRRARLVKLIAHCGALDFENLQPAITITMSNED